MAAEANPPLDLSIRATFVGASEAGAVLGLDEFRSPLDVYTSKVHPDPDDDGGSILSRAGHALEKVILEEYRRRRRCTLTYPGTVRHPKYPMIAATPDAIVVRTVIDDMEGTVPLRPLRGVDAKFAWTSRSREKWTRDEETGEIVVPDRYFVQVQIQAAVFDLDYVDLAALGESDLEIVPVKHDRELTAMWCEQIAEWWRTHVEKRDPPPARSLVDSERYLRSRFPRSTAGFMRAATPEDLTVGRLLLDAKKRRKDIEAEIASLEQILQARIGEAEGIEGIVTWKTDSAGKPSWKAIAEELGAPADVIARHMGEPGRRLLLKLKEAKAKA